jgi:hypothetical protein
MRAEKGRGVWSGTHNLEGEMESLQEWRVGGEIWRSMENRGPYRGSDGVVFFSSSLQILEWRAIWSPPLELL